MTKFVSSGQPASLHFVIEHDDNVGFYLYVFEDDRCVRDYLQDSFDAAVQQAFEQFEVPRDSWKRVEG